MFWIPDQIRTFTWLLKWILNVLGIVLKQFKAFLQLLNSEGRAAESPWLVSPIKMIAIVPALSGSGSALDVALDTFILIQTAVGGGEGGGDKTQSATCSSQPHSKKKNLETSRR